MRRRDLFFLSVLLCGAAVAAVACGSSEQSGACNGTEDGTYWQLQYLNYYTNAPVEVRINGRFVGNVPAGTVNPATQVVTPGQALLGEFPVCDALVVDGRGTGIVTTKLCSTGIFTSQKCHAEKPDYCWISIYLADQPQTGVPIRNPQCDDPGIAPDCIGDWIQC